MTSPGRKKKTKEKKKNGRRRRIRRRRKRRRRRRRRRNTGEEEWEKKKDGRKKRTETKAGYIRCSAKAKAQRRDASRVEGAATSKFAQRTRKEPEKKGKASKRAKERIGSTGRRKENGRAKGPVSGVEAHTRRGVGRERLRPTKGTM